MQVTTELPGEEVGGSDVKWVVGGRKPLVVMSNGWNWSPFPLINVAFAVTILHAHCIYMYWMPRHKDPQCVANLKKISMQILKRQSSQKS